MSKYFSRKFLLTGTALLGCLYYAYTSPLSGTEVAAVIGAIGVLIGQYSASNAFGRDKQD